MKLSNLFLKQRFENDSPRAKPVIAFQRANDIALTAGKIYRANDPDEILSTAVHGSRRSIESSGVRLQLGADVRCRDDGSHQHVIDEREA
jgi:hypothetical protein